MDPDVALSGNTGPDITMASDGSTGPSHQAVPPLPKTILNIKYSFGP